MLGPDSFNLHNNHMDQILILLLSFVLVQMLKNPPAMHETRVQSLGRKDPQRRKWKPTPVFLPGESHGQRSLAGYSTRGCKELDTAEQCSLSF